MTHEQINEAMANQPEACAEPSKEAIRLWRIAVCEPENIEELKKEVAALGTATPEACRALDAFNRRYDKIKANERIQELSRMLKTAQDAAVNAIMELSALQNQHGETGGLDGACSIPNQSQILARGSRTPRANGSVPAGHDDLRERQMDSLEAYSKIDWAAAAVDKFAALHKQWNEKARDAYQAGYEACSEGVARDCGPPETGDLVGEMWDCGWLLKSARMDAEAYLLKWAEMREAAAWARKEIQRLVSIRADLPLKEIDDTLATALGSQDKHPAKSSSSYTQNHTFALTPMDEGDHRRFWESQRGLLAADMLVSFWCDFIAEFHPETSEQKTLAAAIQRTIELLDGVLGCGARLLRSAL